jgi:acyl-CoA hydrolase
MADIAPSSSMRFAGATCVTAGADDFSFHRPVPVSEIALVEAYVYAAGRTSVEVHIRAWREDPRTGDTERTTGANFTFVALGEEGTPVQVPELTVETEEERELREDALEAET